MLKRSLLVASCLLTLTVGASDRVGASNGYNRYSPENVQRLVDLQRECRMVMATVPSEPTPANRTQAPSLWNRVGQRVAGADRGL